MNKELSKGIRERTPQTMTLSNSLESEELESFEIIQARLHERACHPCLLREETESNPQLAQVPFEQCLPLGEPLA